MITFLIFFKFYCFLNKFWEQISSLLTLSNLCVDCLFLPSTKIFFFFWNEDSLREKSFFMQKSALKKRKSPFYCRKLCILRILMEKNQKISPVNPVINIKLVSLQTQENCVITGDASLFPVQLYAKAYSK